MIMQGVIVLSVVIAYELVRRYRVRMVAAEVGRQLASTPPPPPSPPPAALAAGATS
jgi:simple sugar transport system permease protein